MSYSRQGPRINHAWDCQGDLGDCLLGRQELHLGRCGGGQGHFKQITNLTFLILFPYVSHLIMPNTWDMILNFKLHEYL